MTTTTQLRMLRAPLLTFGNGHSVVSAFSPLAARSAALQRLSYSSTSNAPPRQQTRLGTTTTKPPSYAATPTAPILSPSAANPPSTTRPPPLNLPVRQPDTTTFSHLLSTGKAYLTFYKTGLKNIYTNTRLVWSLSSGRGLPTTTSAIGSTYVATPSEVAPAATTRSTELLKMRWRHDVRRVPVFALFLLVCGEFTPLVVLALPGLVPFPCRIPRQVEKLCRRTEERRVVAFRGLEILSSMAETPQANTGSQPVSVAGGTGLPDRLVNMHVARSLSLVSGLWDRIGFVPGFLARSKAQRRIRFLAQDDALLLQAGGVAALEAEEVKLACMDRGIDVLGKSEDELLKMLVRWLQLTRSRGKQDKDAERVKRISVLLTRKPENWPRDGNFELPEYKV